MNVTGRAEQTLRASTPWVKRWARVGYLARGIVYATVGGLALSLALGHGGSITGTEGAVESLNQLPFGKLLLGIVAVGLAGLIAWRVIQLATLRRAHAHSGHGEAKVWVHRMGYLVTAVIYTGLLGATLRTLSGHSAGARVGRGDAAAQDWTARLMSVPFGRVLVLLVGLIVLGYGIHEVTQGIRRKFERKLALEGLAARKAHWVRWVSQFGLVARGFVFGLMGAFLAQAALAFDPGEARGLGGALATLASKPSGDVLLGIVALGLMAFAAYCGLQARYRRFERPW